MDSRKLKTLRKAIPFDQYSRQYQVASMLNSLRRKNASFTVLDVGGYNGKTADFLLGDTITVMDLFDVHEEGYVKGSALDMPFEDGSFDFVISYDVLEHIPTAKRGRFFNECARVAKRGVIICAPQRTLANELAEKKLNDLYKRLHHKQHPWLQEHLAYKLPDFDVVEKSAKAKGFFTTRLHSNQIQLWTIMQQAIFLNSKFSWAAEKLTILNEFYNRHFEYDGGGIESAAYRLILCCMTDRKDQKTIEDKLGEHNSFLDPTLQVQFYEHVNDYYVTLVQKLSNLGLDYQRLHQHEQKRANKLQLENEKLWARINTLEDELNHFWKHKLKHIRHKGK